VLTSYLPLAAVTPAPLPLFAREEKGTATAKGKETAADCYLVDVVVELVLVLLEDLGCIYVCMCIFLSGAPEPASEGVKT